MITFVRTFYSDNNNKNESLLMANINKKHDNIPSAHNENQHFVVIEPFLKPFLPESKVSSFFLNPVQSDKVSKVK